MLRDNSDIPFVHGFFTRSSPAAAASQGVSMMAAEKSYARLGLFVVIGVAIILATGLFFVQQMRSRAVISMVTLHH